jgi:CofD-related protein of GAK system
MESSSSLGRVTVSKNYITPNPLKIERFRRLPELGPVLLFFSGGSAMRGTARTLIQYTHNSVHLMTPFDSGGSSAVLRQAFQMPAVGDIRSRIMDLADQSVRGNPEIYKLFACRLDKTKPHDDLLEEFIEMCRGSHALVSIIPDPMRKIIRSHLIHFFERMPENFPLAGASIGNLVLASGYLEQRKHLDPVVFLYSKLVEARGIVRTVVNRSAHLAVRLNSGDILVGQHRFSGKECQAIDSPITDIWLTSSLEDENPHPVAARSRIHNLITGADLICYPFGSFYSSLIANLLPLGVPGALAKAPCVKVFIPNLGQDPELYGCDLREQIQVLLQILLREGGQVENVLNLILVDVNESAYPGGIPWQWLKDKNIAVLRTELVTGSSRPYADPGQVVRILLSLS